MSEHTIELDDDLVKKTARYEFFRRLTIVLALFLLVATLVTTVVCVILIRGTQQTGSPILKAVLEGQDQIKECTTPGYECFDEGQRRQADVIGDPPGPINTVIVKAVSCADAPGVQTDVEISKCVLQRLRLEAAKKN